MIFKGTNIVLGTWLIISDLSFFSSVWLKMNNMLVGVFVAIIGAAMMNKKLWMGWLIVIVGYWLVLSIFIPCISDGELCMWNSLIVGALLILVGLTIRTTNHFKSKDIYAYMQSRKNRII